MGFECKRCGRCCLNPRSVGLLGFDFPYGVKADGRCEMLTDDNLCMVYEDRPVTCNLKEIANLLGINEEEFYVMNKKGCGALSKAISGRFSS